MDSSNRISPFESHFSQIRSALNEGKGEILGQKVRALKKEILSQGISEKDQKILQQIFNRSLVGFTPSVMREIEELKKQPPKNISPTFAI